MTSFQHDFSFDPAYGYDLDTLLQVGAPEAPHDLADFWNATYDEAMQVPLNITRRPVESGRNDLDVYEIEFDAWGGVRLGGWLTIPRGVEVARGVVLGHGYGGRDAPDLDVAGPPAAVIQPCARGFHRSARADIPNEGQAHVVTGIESRETYIFRGCAADLWAAASALLEVVPHVANNLHYIGGSYGGGMGAIALPWDKRFKRGFLSVPSFGNHPLRVTLPCIGSGHAVREHYLKHPEVLDVLRYFDAATIAQGINIPILCECALFDPAVPPPGQFAVYNALGGEKELHVSPAGHFSYEGEIENGRVVREKQDAWFAD